VIALARTAIAAALLLLVAGLIAPDGADDVVVSTSSTGSTGAMVSTSSTGGGAGELEGYVITREVADVVDLQRIGVHPARQRSGLASDLLETALAETSAGRMLLEVAEDNEAALAFYAQCGFEEIDRRPRYYRSGADAIVMQAALRGR